MKQLLFSLVLVSTCALFSSCGNSDHSKAVDLSNQIQNAVNENRPGTVATTADGYTMKAKVNGQAWEAQSIMPQKDAGYRMIGYYKDEYISLPYSKSNMKAGKKIILQDGEVAEVLFNNGCEWKENAKGEMNITKVDDNWVEGTFAFTTSCKDSKDNLEITDGFFRIPVEK